MQDLLGDPSVLVRVTAVSGVCRVLSLYFELIPFSVMKSLLGRLVKELVWDAAAIDVRVAVLQVELMHCYWRVICSCSPLNFWH